MGIELLHADGWTDRHDEANGCFSQFYKCTSKDSTWLLHYLQSSCKRL